MERRDGWFHSDIAKVSGDSVRTEKFIVCLIHVDTFLIMDQLWEKKSNALKSKHFLLSRTNAWSWAAWFNLEREVSLWFKFNVLNRSALWTLFFLLLNNMKYFCPSDNKKQSAKKGEPLWFYSWLLPRVWPWRGVMIQIIWEPLTQRTDTHKTERPERLDDPLQLAGRRRGLVHSVTVPPPGATYKSRSSSGCPGQLASGQRTRCGRSMNQLWCCQWMPSIVQLCYNSLRASAGSRHFLVDCSYSFINLCIY